MRNPASSDCPHCCFLLCVPHLTVIREPTGRVEAGCPEEWGNREKDAHYRDASLTFLEGSVPSEANLGPKLPESLEHQVDLRTANTLVTPKAPEVQRGKSPHVWILHTVALSLPSSGAKGSQLSSSLAEPLPAHEQRAVNWKAGRGVSPEGPLGKTGHNSAIELTGQPWTAPFLLRAGQGFQLPQV